MARIARLVIPNFPHHIIQRGNRRQAVFFRNIDKQTYIELLRFHSKKAGMAIWAYCLMTNHVHLIAVPKTKESLAKGVGEAHRRYTSMINLRENWKGYLWQGRFISYPLDEKYLYAAVRYVEQNPVRAGLVEKAEDYRWSSARAHVLGEYDSLLSNNYMLSEIKDWAAYLREENKEAEQKLLRLHARTGRPLGDEKFITQLEALTGRVLKRRKPGPKGRN